MGFININGNSVHTSSILSGTNSTTTTIPGSNIIYGSSGYTISSPKTTYHILGEDVEVDGFYDTSFAVTISTLNVLGRPFYDQLLKQNFYFTEKITEVIDKNLKIQERDNKINKIIK